jgi:hypothetical protein|tara:strand:- start:207 stop:392 length:186 start_codon:yes stop_codon:yes gene_type:complete
MRTLIQKFKKNRRKAKHVKFLHLKIAELNMEIINGVLKNIDPNNKAKLLKKYNRRLKLIVY